jgi:transposase
MQRVEIVSDRRRAHDPAFRARVVADSCVPGIRVRDLARKYGICTSLVYRWRREQMAAAGTGSRLQLVPVHLVDEPRTTRRRQVLSQPASVPPPNTVTKAASIEIEFPGGVRVRVDETVNQAALRRIVAVLRG